jgi:hypothetical protein
MQILPYILKVIFHKNAVTLSYIINYIKKLYHRILNTIFNYYVNLPYIFK